MSRSKYIRFTLEIDGIRSVIDSTLPRTVLKQMILDEIHELFGRDLNDLTGFREERIAGPHGGHLHGRYLVTTNVLKTEEVKSDE